MPVRTDAGRGTILFDFQDNPEGPSVAQVESVRRARTRLEAAVRTAPATLGQDTDEVLERLGFESGDIEALRERGVVRPAGPVGPEVAVQTRVGRIGTPSTER